MRKLELKNHDSEEELKKEIRATKNGRYELKLRIVLMLKQGYSPKEIKEILPKYSVKPLASAMGI